ncbi:F-box/LRR-repeat protein 4-like isoform X1 [Asterias rubens]|uniref:F-box/LRR-repeat protein 4-like isoform X1 n=1 Tax=Asterias rubens TaxID=7604 RepID=UPI00145554AC|nr:F-box/LRR-repeat protein 4-like isoform X1 [Asterias rubens]
MFESFFLQLISYIMRFLTSSERHEASLTCKKWYHASLDPHLHQNSTITLRASSTTGETFHNLGQRKSPSLVISHIDGSSNCSKVLQDIGHHLGPHLTHLSLRGSDVTENVFIGIIGHCTGLQSLDLSCCNSLFMSGNLLQKEQDCQNMAKHLDKLTSINLASNRYLSDILFNRLMSATPNLTSLSLASCNIVHQTDPYISGDRKSTSFISLLNFLMYLQHQSKLTSLDLSYTGIGNAALLQIGHVMDLVLEELILKKCTSVSNEGVMTLVKKQTSLKSLDLSGIASLTGPALIAICNHLPNLEHLKASEWSQLDPNAVERLSSLKRLKSLDLANCYHVGLHFLIKGLCSGSSSRLTALCLGGCGSVHDETVLNLVKSLPQLEQLDLSSCFGVGDPSVLAISRFLPNLRKLRLAWCKKITDFGLLGLDKDAPVFITDDAEKHYSDRFTKSHSNMGFFKLPSFNEKILAVPETEILRQMEEPDQINLTALTKLESLDLMACNHLTDVCIAHTVRFPKLRSLSFSLCSNITDHSLAAMATNNPNLTELLIGQCHQITDVGMASLAVKCKGLRSLDVCGCDKITDATLSQLGAHTKHLQHLNVCQCTLITMEAADQLQQQIPSLRSLQMAHTSSNGSAFYHYQPIRF